MIITTELLHRIRRLLNEEIPSGGTADDTRFSDADIAIVVQQSESENHALYLLWTQKAGLVQKNTGTIKRIQAGGETTEHYTAQDFVQLALKTAEGYRLAWSNEKKSGNQSVLVYGKKESDLW